MNVIAKRLEWDMGHRLLRHESKCAHLHGHRYAATFLVSAKKLDRVGRVLDFSVVKTVMGSWIDARLDHSFAVQAGDPLLAFLVKHDQRHFVMNEPPTAENLARLLYREALARLPEGVRVEAVHVQETPTSVAIYSPRL